MEEPGTAVVVGASGALGSAIAARLARAGLVVVGAAVGAGLAALLAPASGGEIRRTIKRQLRAAGRKGREMVQEVTEGDKGGDDGGRAREAGRGERGPEQSRSPLVSPEGSPLTPANASSTMGREANKPIGMR